jgi:hypothetical protein
VILLAENILDRVLRMFNLKKLRKPHKEEFPNLYSPPGNIGRVIRLKEDKPDRTSGISKESNKYPTEVTIWVT